MNADGISLSSGKRQRHVRNKSLDAVLGSLSCVARWRWMLYIRISVNATTQEDLKLSAHIQRCRVLGSVRYEGLGFFGAC